MEKEQLIDLSMQHANPITKPFIAQEITKVENKLNAKILATDKKLAHEITNFNKEKTAFDNKLEKMIGNLDNKVTEKATQLGNQIETLKEETTAAKNQLSTRITELDNKVKEDKKKLGSQIETLTEEVNKKNENLYREINDLKNNSGSNQTAIKKINDRRKKINALAKDRSVNSLLFESL